MNQRHRPTRPGNGAWSTVSPWLELLGLVVPITVVVVIFVPFLRGGDETEDWVRVEGLAGTEVDVDHRMVTYVLPYFVFAAGRGGRRPSRTVPLTGDFGQRPAARARIVLAVLVASSTVLLASACSREQAPSATATTTSTIGATGSTAPITATAPPVQAGVKDCGEANELAGWPTTTVPLPQTYRCILVAFATGTSARMSHTALGAGNSGRATRDGYELPTRSITTWLVLGQRRVQETIDRTEDGKGSVTRVCTGLALAGYVPKATGCSK